MVIGGDGERIFIVALHELALEYLESLEQGLIVLFESVDFLRERIYFIERLIVQFFIIDEVLLQLVGAGLQPQDFFL